MRSYTTLQRYWIGTCIGRYSKSTDMDSEATKWERNVSGTPATLIFDNTGMTYSGRVPATVSWANVFTFSLMTWIPRSSDALSSSTLCLYSTGLRHSGWTKVHKQNVKIRQCNMFVWPVNMFQGLGHQTRPHTACNNFNRSLLLSCLFKRYHHDTMLIHVFL